VTKWSRYFAVACPYCGAPVSSGCFYYTKQGYQKSVIPHRARRRILYAEHDRQAEQAS
jgi:hypothetical protein